MSCSCTRCTPKYFGGLRATAVADGNNLIITICNFCPSLIIQGDKLSFVIQKCFDYPDTKINNVKISVNGTEFDAIRFGNVKWDQISSRVCYTGVFGTEEPTLTILNDLPRSKYDYPEYSTACTTAEETDAE